MFRTLRSYQLTVDLVVAALFLCAPLLSIMGGFNTRDDLVVLALMAGGLAVRRVSPGLALVIVWVGALAQMLLHATTPAFADIAILAVLYCAANYGGSLVRWAGLASAVLGAIVATLYLLLGEFFGNGLGLSELVHSGLLVGLGSLATLGLSWTVGFLVRTARRAGRSRRAQAVAERDVIVEQERNRIARDMHDVVAHSLAVVIAQADGARYAQAKEPAAVETALSTISATAREALGDVRVLLSQLRHSESEAPQPILADLDTLIPQFADSGLTVARSETGSPWQPGGGQQLALYRIAQEALTNALRHGDTGQETQLELAWAASSVTLTVSSALGSAADNPAGHGLAGIRERATLAGGTVEIGQAGDRWRVIATIPAATA
ncbi:MAG: hypothetical protein JWO10_107 [Microbacteriaceae bacterium]|nr:hypothetical protein [Microbacteriaceae bacterium]